MVFGTARCPQVARCTTARFRRNHGPQTTTCVFSLVSARFDRSELYEETIRYFHDDDAISDPFDEEVVQSVPPRLLPEIGFFLVPAHRTWDRLMSFNSELFRRILESSGSLEAAEVLAERDRLRRDEHRVDLQGVLKELREGIDAQLKQLVPGSPGLELRLTATDTESLLRCWFLITVIPIPCLNPPAVTARACYPCRRHSWCSRSLSAATERIRMSLSLWRNRTPHASRCEAPPPHPLRNSSNQSVCTTHSPRVAAVCSATESA